MTINNIHISDFGGILLGYDISPPDIKNNYFKADNFSFPILYNTDIGMPGLTVRLVFESDNKEKIIRNLSKFRALCHKQSEIKFDISLVYDCIYTTEKLEKVTGTFFKVTISFACITHS